MAAKNQPIVDWLEIESSAPAKFILSGEYSVVYERHAVAATIDIRTRVLIRPRTDGKIRLDLKCLNSIREWPTIVMNKCRLVSRFSECLEFDDSMPSKLNHLLHSRYMITEKSQSSNEQAAEDAAMAFLLLYIGLGDSYASSARPAIDVDVDSEIPVGSGLGSSSAYSVALCGALMRVFRVVAERYIISNWAFSTDKFFHGKPSGVDNSVITSGGYILFQNGKVKATNTTHKAPIRVLLVDTCVSRSTKAVCSIVTKQNRENPSKVNEIFNQINEMTMLVWQKVKDAEFLPKSVAPFLKANQEKLNELGVGHPKLEDIRSRALRYGLIAKQTGAGGGGTAFVIYSPAEDRERIEELQTELLQAGYKTRDYPVGCDGLMVRLTPDQSKNLK